MTPASPNFIKFLARIAVERYLDELHQHEKLSSQEIGSQPYDSSNPGGTSISTSPHQTPDSAAHSQKEK